MALLVVPLSPDETGLLTLSEWDALLEARMVLFERPDHPLAARLRSAGVEAGPFDDEPDPEASDVALVADPSSARILELARAGARVMISSAIAPDDLSAAYAAPVLRRVERDLGTLVAVMARLRSEDGCPWDIEQDHGSLLIHLLEEAHEVIEAVEAGTTGVELEEELGDVLLQVAFHARIAEQDGRFDISGVARAVATKLIRRHPHVFGDVAVADADDVVRNWEAIKRQERDQERDQEGDRPSPFAGIAPSLPALLATYKIQKRAASLGFSPDEGEARAKLAEALEADAIGDALFWLVAVARSRGVDPESGLRGAAARFTSRYEAENPD